MSKCLLWVGSFFDGEAATIYSLWGTETECDNQPSKDILGIDYTPLQTMMDDMIKAMIETGYVEDKRKA